MLNVVCLLQGELIEGGEEGVEGQQAPAMGFAAGLMMKALIPPASC